MKYCGTCKTEKPCSEFGARKASSDGLAHKCKQCQKEYDKSRLKDPKRMKARRDYQKTETGKARHKEATKRWVDRNTIKRAAHIIAGNAIRKGSIVRRDCEVCGKQNAEAHHDDYARPLDVRWLCVEHHNEWHRLNGEGANAT